MHWFWKLWSCKFSDASNHVLECASVESGLLTRSKKTHQCLPFDVEASASGLRAHTMHWIYMPSRKYSLCFLFIYLFYLSFFFQRYITICSFCSALVNKILCTQFHFWYMQRETRPINLDNSSCHFTTHQIQCWYFTEKAIKLHLSTATKSAESLRWRVKSSDRSIIRITLASPSTAIAMKQSQSALFNLAKLLQ